jgi:CRP-like cAMP-binding protein
MFGRSDPRLDLIASMPLFAGCSKKELRELTRIVRPVEYPAGHVLIRQGEHGSECYLIVEGEVDIERDGVKLNTLGPGDMVGEIALISSIVRTATVTTTTAVQLLVIAAINFKRIVRDNPTIAVHVLESLSERIPSWLSLPSFASPPSD